MSNNVTPLMRNVLLFLLLSSLGCKKKKNEEPYVVETHSNHSIKFNDYFFIVDSSVICFDEIDSPVFWYERKNGNLIIGNYNNGKVWIKSGSKFIAVDQINKSTPNFIATVHPIAVAFDEKNRMFVADNTQRRILVYDSLYKQISSFIFSGSHMTPVSMSVSNNKIYAGAFNKPNGTLMQVYDTNGSFVRSIMTSDDSDKEHYSHTWETLNYVHSTSIDRNVFAVQTTNYFIHKFDSTTFLSKKILLKLDYFQPLTDSLRTISKDFFDVREKYCFPVNISAYEDLLFVQTKCPEK